MDIDLEQPVPSVGIQSMDTEHEHCEAALAKLQSELTPEALDLVCHELTAHFSHEEKLMKAHGFGEAGANGTFSPLVSHTNDHERIRKSVNSA